MISKKLEQRLGKINDFLHGLWMANKMAFLVDISVLFFILALGYEYGSTGVQDFCYLVAVIFGIGLSALAIFWSAVRILLGFRQQ